MNVEIAQRLAAMRREKGYSQEALASKLGLSRQAVSKWERAESQPDTGNLIALADLYGVTLDELVRVDADIADDVRFEEVEKNLSGQTEVKEAATTATAAAEKAEAAAVRAEEAADAVCASPSEEAPDSPTNIEAALEQASDAPCAQSSSPTVAPTPMDAAEQPPEQPWCAATVETVPPQGHLQPFETAPAPLMQSQPTPAPLPRSPWLTFPYPLLVVVLFLLGGFLFGAWNPGWVLFLTIPFYYWAVHVIVHDPKYQAEREKRLGR